MINILNKEDCCGCNACVQICPKKCITLELRKDGFKYPRIHLDKCIGCGLCEKSCPIINKKRNRNSLNYIVYAAISNHYESLVRSSSGGIFFQISTFILEKNGYVSGAVFDKDWNVIHTVSNNLDDIKKMQGSKYVQSEISNTFIRIKELLNNDVIVLFSGTPCQVSALKNFLHKEYENLLTIDFVCHGVPSPVAWTSYLNYLKWDKIKYINFRDKRNGWEKYNITLKGIKSGDVIEQSNRGKSDIFFRGFLSHLYLRPSCYKCAFRNGNNKSDITLGDCWGVKKIIPNISKTDYNNGISVAIIRTSKGLDLINKIISSKRCKAIKIPYQKIVEYNPSLNFDSKPAWGSSFFFTLLNYKCNFKFLVLALCAINKLLRIVKRQYV